jgi:hypothetical protein
VTLPEPLPWLSTVAWMNREPVENANWALLDNDETTEEVPLAAITA